MFYVNSQFSHLSSSPLVRSALLCGIEFTGSENSESVLIYEVPLVVRATVSQTKLSMEWD